HTKVITFLKVFLAALSFLFFIGFGFSIYKNTYNGINLQGQETKIFQYNDIAYDLSQWKLFNGVMFARFKDEKKNIQYEINIRDGKLNGEITTYYPNGNLKSVGSYKENTKDDGCALYYYENGNVEAKFCFKNGQQHGIQEMFYKNGNKKSQSYYREGQALGDQFFFRENGTLLYKVDNTNETIEEFDEEGKASVIDLNEENKQKIRKKMEEILWKN
ncbi:hypothetical protein OQH60_08520, partial [Campylobacter sp. MIT 21-1685]|uniref:toxin-antitoxin system YwqK family antitoxin n=1 Tax=unclassified Campylobacter TaxID=2593542 RepID=UPI0029FA50B9|nr:hypothetical protein [Campylobacter sp. MIT 21-1684]MCX2752184.1 hypothetical protein [Campylobacter sp. MIT 21-1682]MCX2808377.1 hypothetical protein [Campylobacter sp. MIT 21-1685]